MFSNFYPVIRDCVLEYWYCEKALIDIKMVNKYDKNLIDQFIIRKANVSRY